MSLCVLSILIQNYEIIKQKNYKTQTTKKSLCVLFTSVLKTYKNKNY